MTVKIHRAQEERLDGLVNLIEISKALPGDGDKVYSLDAQKIFTVLKESLPQGTMNELTVLFATNFAERATGRALPIRIEKIVQIGRTNTTAAMLFTRGGDHR